MPSNALRYDLAAEGLCSIRNGYCFEVVTLDLARWFPPSHESEADKRPHPQAIFYSDL